MRPLRFGYKLDATAISLSLCCIILMWSFSSLMNMLLAESLSQHHNKFTELECVAANQLQFFLQYGVCGSYPIAISCSHVYYFTGIKRNCTSIFLLYLICCQAKENSMMLSWLVSQDKKAPAIILMNFQANRHLLISSVHSEA